MSFKIFTLQTLGKIKSVEWIEKKREVLLQDYSEFLEVESSKELEKFLELEEWINSTEFKKKKEEIDALQFKGSTEFKQLQELASLKKASKIKKYFKIADSSDLRRFEELKDSKKLEEYDRLLDYVKEGQFEKEKKEIKSQTYKGSVEEKHWIDFKKLDKSKSIKAYLQLKDSADLKKHEEFADSDKLKKFVSLKNAPERDKEKQKEYKNLRSDSEIKVYFKFEKSKKLMLYRETVGSHQLKKYNELKAYVENEDYKKRESFLKDKKKFEKSEAYQRYQKYKNLAADRDIKFVLKFEKLALYKNYLDVKDSYDLKRFFELQEITTSQKFIERKAYLEDKKKWEKTEDFGKQQEYLEMKELPHLIRYFKYKDSSDFDFFNEWELTFEDDFSTSVLNDEKWSTIGFVAEKTLGDNYAMPGDLHLFTKGKNVKTNGKLTISVKKERGEGKVWKMPAGFIPTEFDYTSDLISSGSSFWQEDGVFEAKIKFNPTKQVVSSLYLAGENGTPKINLLEMGTKNNVGISTLNSSGKIEIKGLDISNLRKGKSYIFTLEKTGSTMNWKINEKEVLNLQDSSVNFPLHLNASSIVVHEIPGSALPVNFEIEWIKCYRKK